ncbi:MAG: hypothetical protein ABIA08_01750 [bacterium]
MLTISLKCGIVLLGGDEMKASIHPKYTKNGKSMTFLEITILIDDGEEKVVDNFLETTKKNGKLEINDLPIIAGRNLAVDIKPK